MAETVALHLGVGLDVRDFAAFAKALRQAEPTIHRTLMLRLRSAGAVVAEEARGLAGEHSASIPPSIKVRISGASVAVVAGGKDVPLAGLFELGNKGNRKADPATFRHMVFGHDVWVTQPTHPFLGPAVRANIDAVEVAAVEALDAAIAEVVSSRG